MTGIDIVEDLKDMKLISQEEYESVKKMEKALEIPIIPYPNNYIFFGEEDL